MPTFLICVTVFTERPDLLPWTESTGRSSCDCIEEPRSYFGMGELTLSKVPQGACSGGKETPVNLIVPLPILSTGITVHQGAGSGVPPAQRHSLGCQSVGSNAIGKREGVNSEPFPSQLEVGFQPRQGPGRNLGSPGTNDVATPPSGCSTRAETRTILVAPTCAWNTQTIVSSVSPSWATGYKFCNSPVVAFGSVSRRVSADQTSHRCDGICVRMDMEMNY